ncbi:MAG: hypothetical protein JJ892_04995 [Balneola sp.]|nr:hypothetical protein [Balneola sp.]MBO6651577.1 hypothetical protein [Balneola sp.]MBO6710930.1 hypothetical protein [Balneola sp.]MBO6799617.1 hypothetical protein [Balneola sp.]MBO6870350.1 hypothetical protein [Balneola sp.]
MSACSLNLDKGSLNTITQEDIEAVGQIIGESLSDENSGIIGSFYDAITQISSSGFIRTSNSKAKTGGHDDNAGRGDESDISYKYISETGVHELSFERFIEINDYKKQVFDTLRYIYKNQDGQFINDLNLVDGNTSSIVYTSARNGEIQTLSRTSFFARKDTFLINGVNSQIGVLEVDGVHNGSGFFQSVTLQNETPFERAYQLEVNFLNIVVEKAVIDQNISLEQGASGTLSYSLVIEDPNDKNVSRAIRGSLDLVGDGTAMLRFASAPSLFQINLDNGNVTDLSREFEGKIISVNISQSSFTLASGITVKINDQTKVSAESDLFTLQAVSTALESTPFVRAEGVGVLDNEVFKASEVEFELDEDNDDENDELEFEQGVQSVDLQKNTFTLLDGTIIGVDEGTSFESEGDYISLEEVANALNNQIGVIADGSARYIDQDSLNYIATEVEFEAGSDTEDDDTINFNGMVQSVNLSGGTFTLDNGAVIQVTEETVISGDLMSLQAVKDALDAGQEIEADGRAVENSENQGINLIALNVEFEV